MLVAVHDIGVQNLREDGQREGIRSLSPHVPRAGHDAHVEIAVAHPFRRRPEGNEARGNAIGHVARQLERISFGAADDAGRAEQRRDDVQHPWSRGECQR
jgi:hypothetical protein